MFPLREINQMEREMCSYLEWQLNVDPTTLRDFQARVQLDFAGQGPYPPMVLPQPAPAPFSHQSTGNNILTQVRVPLFRRSLPAYPCPKMRPLFPVPRFEHTPHHPPIPQRLPTRPRLLPRHRYRRRRRPMLTGQDSLSKLCRQIRARSSLLSSPTTRVDFSRGCSLFAGVDGNLR
jgi:hypothetical protein